MNSDWTDLKFRIASRDLEKASAIAEMCVGGGIYVEDYSDLEDYISGFMPDELVSDELMEAASDREHAVLHVYISPDDSPAEAMAFMTERLNASGILFEAVDEKVREEDWANNWKQYFKPLPVGRGLIVVPTWDDSVPPEYSGRTRIVIDPGMAFGSGQHETTRLCLEMIEKYLKSGERVLDVGTGSGILAIGALLLGAGESVGIDIDPLAVRISRENAERSGLGGRFTSECRDLAGETEGKFGLIVANIVADVVIRLIPDTRRLLADGGMIILSGIITERRRDVENVLSCCGYEVADSAELKGWCALAARRTNNKREVTT